MLRRIWNAIVAGFTPHPERFDDSAELGFSIAEMEAPTFSAPIEAARAAASGDKAH